MTAIKANGITIEYEEMGPPDAPVILLIMGLGMQLIAWPEPFCGGLAARGFRVVRFDNRDAGLSTRMPSAGSLATSAMMLLGLPVRPPYTLNDMARDTVGLMDALGIDHAHVIGASMGGMIAQIVAIEHPERVKSLTSIMSTSGDRAAAGPEKQSAARAASPAPARQGVGRPPLRCSASSAAPVIRELSTPLAGKINRSQIRECAAESCLCASGEESCQPPRSLNSAINAGRAARRRSRWLSGHISMRGKPPLLLCPSIQVTASAVNRPLVASTKTSTRGSVHSAI